MAERNFEIPFSRPSYRHGLPDNFQPLRILGSGHFGKVYKCLKKDTDQIVAVKIPKIFWPTAKEGQMLEMMMHLNLDRENIVQFLGWFYTFTGRALVFEPLTMSLRGFLRQRHWAPMLLSDIRDIIQQLATAFNALKRIGVIHTILTIDNVMIVENDGSQPLRVKLIDFCQAIDRSSAKQGMHLQVFPDRAPEVILGLPITEAIDMWSLGCLTAFLLRGRRLFQGRFEFDLLPQISALLGQPKDYLLDAGVRTEKYFIKTENNSWRLKTDKEYFYIGESPEIPLNFSLDDLRKVRREKGNRLEAVQREQCIDLLERMLCLDWSKRITPSQILNHPFIRSDIKGTTHHPTIPPGVILVRPADPENRRQLDTDEEISEEAPASLSDINIEIITPSPTTIPPGVILVRPADPKNRLQLDTDEEISEEAPASLSDINIEIITPSPTTIPPGVILVRPVDPKNRRQLDTDEEISEEAPAALSDIKIEITTPSPTTIPPGVILVRPADPKNRRQLDTDEEISEEAPASLSDINIEIITPSPTTIPPGVILVRPADPKNRRQLDTDEEISEEAPAALNDINREITTPSPTTIPPGVILVRPADPKNRLQLDTDEEMSEEAPASLSDINIEITTPSPTTTRIPCPVILFRSAAAEDEERSARLPSRLNSDTTSEGHDGAETQMKTSKKKKKNCFQRFFSWLKKNSCCTAAADD